MRNMNTPLEVALSTLKRNKCVEWKGYLLSCCNEPVGNEAPTENISKKLEESFSKITGEGFPEIKTFVCASNNSKRGSVSLSMNGMGQEFGGNPLLLDEDLVFDSSLVQSRSFYDEKSLLTLASARLFVSAVISSLNKSGEDYSDSMPMLVMCNGSSNKKGIYFFCIHQDVVEENHGFSYMMSNSVLEDASNSIKVDVITCRGQCRAQVFLDAGMTKIERLAQRVTFQPHLLDCFGELPKGSRMTMKVFSEHEIQCDGLKEIDEDCKQGSVEICCDKVTDVFGINSSKVNSVNLTLRPVPGSRASQAYLLYKDLKIVEGLMKALTNLDAVKWAKLMNDDLKDAEKNESAKHMPGQESVANKIKLAMKTLDSVQLSKRKALSKEDEKEEEVEAEFIEARKELDFTEMMWDLLKFVSDLEELVNCLGIIFAGLRQGGAQKFWLHRDNNTILAKYVKDSYQGKFTPPSLRGFHPFEILIEIGIDKLTRDYASYFTTKFTHASLVGKLTVVSGDLATAEKLEELMVGVRKLHHVTELAAQGTQLLLNSQNHLAKMIRNALQSYQTEDYNPRKLFSIALPYNEAKVFVEDKLPCVWRLSTVGNTPNGKNCGILCWCKNFPFSGIVSPPKNDIKEMSIEEQEEQEVMYYLTTCERSMYFMHGN